MGTVRWKGSYFNVGASYMRNTFLLSPLLLTKTSVDRCETEWCNLRGAFFFIILWSSYIRYVFSFSFFLVYQFIVKYNFLMLICWECTAYTLWHITISLCLRSHVVLIYIFKVLLDHLDKPYSDCLVNLRDQAHVDAYQEIHGTNYSMRVMPAQKIQYF